jgi:hypothetical protein
VKALLRSRLVALRSWAPTLRRGVVELDEVRAG